MASVATEPLWSPTVAIGIPPPLRDHAATLEHAHENCGLVTNGLQRLTDVEELLADAINRNDKQLRAVHGRVQKELAEVRQRLLEELAAFRTEVVQREARVHRQVDDVLDRVRISLEEVQEHNKRNVENVLVTAKSSNSMLSTAVRKGQSLWMRLQSQLMVFNAWSVAWPVAVRGAQEQTGTQSDSTTGPPTYNL
ncbi:hypothetical protein CF319_g7628 [Tilletia indica]|nr:hypothetical protein CF319_g7628 [Tilletia indica]